MSLLIGNSIPSSTPKNLQMQATPHELSKLHMYICIHVTRIQEKRKIFLPSFKKTWKLFFWLDTKGSIWLQTSLSFSFDICDVLWVIWCRAILVRECRVEIFLLGQKSGYTSYLAPCVEVGLHPLNFHIGSAGVKSSFHIKMEWNEIVATVWWLA